MKSKDKLKIQILEQQVSYLTKDRDACLNKIKELERNFEFLKKQRFDEVTRIVNSLATIAESASKAVLSINNHL